jgi:RNase P/RNase MRP subunit p29
VDDLLEQLMTPNMPPATARSMISNRTVDKSVVLENPTAKLNITRPSKGRRQQQLTAQLLPRAQRIALCQLPPTGVDYAALLPLHELWSKYAAEQLAGKAEPERLLQGLDWHGAVLRVTSCKNPIYVGRAGIVAKATANTFVMVAPDGRSSVVPLKGAVLECMVPGLEHAVQLSSSGGMAKLQCRMLLEGAQS